MSTNTPAISVTGLHKQFGRTAALAGLDLHVEAGEVAGFLGPDGSGKSTTIRMLGVLLCCQKFIPRPSTSIAWVVYGLSVMAAMFGGLLSLSGEVIEATPFGAVPRLPAGNFALLPLVVLGVIALVLGTIGFWRFRARDLMPD